MSTDMWVPDISRIDGPRYLAVAGAIARAIDNGELPPGAQLPPQRDLAERLGVTVGTVSRAYALAKKRRLIAGEVGRGTFVQGVGNRERTGNVIPKLENRGIDLSCFRSPVEGLNNEILELLSEVSGRASLLPLHKYAPEAGSTSHRLAGTSWIARTGYDVPADNILITTGAQQAIFICLATLVNHGGTLLTEELTYSGVKALCSLHGSRLRAVAMDDQGMIPEALEQAAVESGARVVYMQPTIHNPTTITMPESRRKRIAAIAERHDLVIIEDDAAASAVTERPLPISALIPNRSCYITSLSKSISPTLRVGYIAAGQQLIGALTDTFHTLSLSSSPITAEIAALLIGDGTADEIARNYIAMMNSRLEVALPMLPPGLVRSRAGAFYLWLTLPDRWNTDDFSAAARRAGVSVAPVESFQVERISMSAGIRLSLNPASQVDVLAKGLSTLGELIGSRPQARQTVI